MKELVDMIKMNPIFTKIDDLEEILDSEQKEKLTEYLGEMYKISFDISKYMYKELSKIKEDLEKEDILKQAKKFLPKEVYNKLKEIDF